MGDGVGEGEKRGGGGERGGFIEREGVDMMINRGEGIYAYSDFWGKREMRVGF